MRLNFLDRENERSRLVRAFSADEGTFCCLYGRRRCGKSRLLRETLPKRRSVYFVAEERESSLQRAALASAVSQLVPGFDQVNYPDWNSLLERWWRDAPSKVVLALDEFPYLVKSSPELPALVPAVTFGHEGMILYPLIHRYFFLGPNQSRLAGKNALRIPANL